MKRMILIALALLLALGPSGVTAQDDEPMACDEYIDMLQADFATMQSQTDEPDLLDARRLGQAFRLMVLARHNHEDVITEDRCAALPPIAASLFAAVADTFAFALAVHADDTNTDAYTDRMEASSDRAAERLELLTEALSEIAGN